MPPDSRLVSRAPRRSRCSPCFIHGLLPPGPPFRLRRRRFLTSRSNCLALAAALFAAGAGAGTGAPIAEPKTITGRVVLAENGLPAGGAEVHWPEAGRVTRADDEGRFRFEGAEPGARITLRAELGFLSGQVSLPIGLLPGAPPDFAPDGEIALPQPIRIEFRPTSREHITVTAVRGDSSGLGGFGSVSSFEGLELQQGSPSLAELLQGAPGVAIRSLGPGPARPILRGFDGDRVLVLEDGIRTGDLSSQAPEHGLAVDPTQADRIEIVRGPAALLYGASAVGGAVNVVGAGSRAARGGLSGFRGRASLGAGSADGRRQAGARFLAGGERFFAWGGGNLRRGGDYRSPLGVVPGSATRMDQGEAGLGFRGERAHVAAGFRIDDSRFGVPLAGLLHSGGAGAEEDTRVEVGMERRQLRTDFGFRRLPGVFEEAAFTIRLSDFVQDELETAAGGSPRLETRHENRSLVFRGEVERPGGPFRSRVGVWAHLRDFASAGEEAKAPDTRQTAFAAFAHQEIRASGRIGLLLGARLEKNAYDAEARPDAPDDGEENDGENDGGNDAPAFEPPVVMDREFLGLSASAGLRLDLGEEHALVGTATLSSRAPALEELYNFGLDAGIQAFEIGDPSLRPEHSRSFDLRLSRDSRDFTGSISVFRYDITNFTYGAIRGGRGGVTVISSEQARARHLGFEFAGRLRLGGIDLDGSASWVDARLPDLRLHAPRIPPLSGQLKLDIPIRRLRIAPRLRWAARMDRLHLGETATDGYAVADLSLSLLLASRRATHSISLVARNLTNARYRRHTSLIKDLAPERGRDIRLSYAIRFF